MGHQAALTQFPTIRRHTKGNNGLTTELVKLSVDQYNKDNDLGKLKKELQKISLLCSRSRLFKKTREEQLS
jgi:hypothetical protein